MGRALSADLRKRVIRAIEGGLSTRAAARRFSIGIATAGHWYRRYRRTGLVAAQKQGQPQRSKLDIHEAFILGLVAENKDITLMEIAARLAGDYGVKACVGTIWKFFDKRGITYKKRRRTLQSKSVLM
jgi:transposase